MDASPKAILPEFVKGGYIDRIYPGSLDEKTKAKLGLDMKTNAFIQLKFSDFKVLKLPGNGLITRLLDRVFNRNTNLNYLESHIESRINDCTAQLKQAIKEFNELNDSKFKLKNVSGPRSLEEFKIKKNNDLNEVINQWKASKKGLDVLVKSTKRSRLNKQKKVIDRFNNEKNKLDEIINSSLKNLESNNV